MVRFSFLDNLKPLVLRLELGDDGAANVQRRFLGGSR